MNAESRHLCAACARCLVVRTPRSVFYRCLRSDTEPERYRKYPPTPVTRCMGFEAGEPKSSPR